MDMKKWLAEMENQLVSLKNLDLGYPQGNNFILPPDDKNLLDELLKITELKLPEELINFYRECGGVNLPDIWNGYFIFSLAKIIASIQNATLPTKINGTYQGAILVFAADGGGNLFAIHLTKSPVILYLPSESIQDDTITHAYLRPKDVSNNFSDFLLRLIEDTQAFIRCDSKWAYMDKNLYSL